MTAPAAEDDAVHALGRHQRAAGLTVGLCVLGYLGFALWAGFSETAAELMRFDWSMTVPVLALTLVNYGLRLAKWHWLLQRLGAGVPLRTSTETFVAGLGMVVSPAKAGELIKPWLVREINGAPMARTIPALVTERLTDGIAVVMLAAVGVSTFYPEQTGLIAGTLVACALGLVAISVAPLVHGALNLLDRLAPLPNVVARLREAYDALRTCLSPGALFVTVALSLIAWWAECVGCWLVLRGFGAEVGLDAATFLYAFATVFGAPTPGGVGMADVALVEGAVALIPGLDRATSLAAALLVRIATLWFGVLLGAVMLVRVDAIITAGRKAQET